MSVLLEDVEILGLRPTFVLRNEWEADVFRSHGGAPEKPLIEWAITQFTGDGTRFLDIGANVGTWSIPIAMLGGIVHAFEPQVKLAKRLHQGAILNGCGSPRLNVVNVALSDHEDWDRLTAPEAGGGAGSIVIEFENPAEDEWVQVQRLDDYPYINPTLIKIDVEGAELDVLRGGKQVITQNRPPIIMEVWSDERGQRKEELFRYLSDELDYDAEPISWLDTWLALPR